MLLLAFAGLITLAQSTRCYCGAGGAYYNTDGKDPCYFFTGEHKIWNIQGSWEGACNACGEKAIEKMKAAGHCPHKVGESYRCDRECFACVKYSLSGMYMARPGWFHSSSHYSRETMKCGRTEKYGRSLISDRQVNSSYYWYDRQVQRMINSDRLISEADRFYGVEPSRDSSTRNENLMKFCKSDYRCGPKRVQELGYDDFNDCVRDCWFKNN